MMTDKEKSEQLHHWKAGLAKSPYLGSWDLPNVNGKFENIQLTITHVVKQMTEGLKDNEICNIAYFQEKNYKPMILNATNAKMLRAITGSPFIENWRNVRVEIRVEKNVKAFGALHDTLRIVNKKIEIVKPKLTKDHSKFAEIVKRVKEGTTTVDVISQYYELTDDFNKAIGGGK